MPEDRINEIACIALCKIRGSKSVENAIQILLDEQPPAVEYGFWVGFALGKMAARNSMLKTLKVDDPFFGEVEA